MTERTLDLAATFAVIGADGAAIPVDAGPTLYEGLDRRFDGFKGRHLVACHSFEADWPTWEMHPAGDEIVCLLAGEARMVFERDGREEVIVLGSSASYVIVPKGTWHTARIAKAAKMLFITPGEGTLHRAR